MVKGSFDESSAIALDHAIAALLEQGTKLDVLWIDRPGTGPSNTIDIGDREGVLSVRYDLRDAGIYLVRPDQHVCARWRELDADAVLAAVRRALGYELAAQEVDPLPLDVAVANSQAGMGYMIQNLLSNHLGPVAEDGAVLDLIDRILTL